MILKLLFNTQKISMIATQIKKQKILIIFDDIIAHMISKRNLQPIVVELFIRGVEN